MACTVLVSTLSMLLSDALHAQPPASLTLPELVRRDGVFCDLVTPQKPHLCDSVIRIVRINPQEAWITYTGLVKARNKLPAVKIRLGHFATIQGDEVCVQADTARLTIELFEAVDARIGISPEERPMDALAQSRKEKIDVPEGRKVTCRGLTKSGYLLTFGDVPKPMRFVPLAETTRLRLHAFGGGL